MTETASEDEKPVEPLFAVASDADCALYEVPPGRVDSRDLACLVPDIPRPPARKRAPGDGKPPEWHALYRLYDAEDVLLYVGETNAPVERYLEHHDTKDWWSDVARHSILWFRDGREAVREREKSAIRDEWPLHNIAHQPRGDGSYMIPSYVAGKICEAIESVALKVLGEGHEGQAKEEVAPIDLLTAEEGGTEVAPGLVLDRASAVGWIAGAPDWAAINAAAADLARAQADAERAHRRVEEASRRFGDLLGSAPAR